MDKIKQFKAHVRPSGFARRMFAHQGNLSEFSKASILAERTILGKKAIFFTNGEHILKGRIDLTEEEMFKSHILRYAHASLLVNEPVGDKKRIWVDATVDPVNIWLYGMTIQKFIQQAKMAIKRGTVEPSFILDQHPEHFVEETKNVRNVRLSGNCIN